MATNTQSKEVHDNAANPTSSLAKSLGNVRLRDRDTHQVILIPTPSADPNDPLNWSQWYKHYIAGLICFAMLMCNFLAAGPSIAITETTLDFFPDQPMLTSISKTAFFFTSTALILGVGNFVWVPLANKYGRRPVYVASYTVYFAASLWLVFERSFTGFLAGRILMGFGAGAAETLAPMTITDIFFLHERGAVMSFYTAFLSIGVGSGLVISGLVTIHYHWRVIYEVACALVGLVLILAIATFPETAWPRKGSGDEHGRGSVDTHATASPSEEVAPRYSYRASLALFRTKLTEEGLLKLFLRPFALIILPPVLWTALVQAVTIGFLVAVTSNVAPAMHGAYGFEAWQAGLCFVASIIGSLLGIPAGGHLGDKVADFLTRRNGGVRDPEMRLPAIMLALITTPLSLVLFGVGIQYQLHWTCPTIGLGLLNFSITQGTNICLVYVIDAYRPVVGEVTLSVMGFKSIFGFLLSFYTNPWVQKAGYLNAYGTMAGISAAIIVLWVPLFVWGKKIRHTTWQWLVISYIHWENDREVGE